MVAGSDKNIQSKTTRKSTTTRKKTVFARRRKPAKRSRAKDIESIAQSSANIVCKAASILEEEVSAGVTAARQVENGLTGKKEFSSKDFSSTVSRFRKDAHDIVNLIGNSLRESDSSVADSKKKSDGDKASGFQTSAREIFNLLINLVENAPAIVENMSQLDILSTT